MAELLSSLHDRSLPLSDKLKVACYLWRHDQFSGSDKNAFLLQWACQELCQAYSKKLKRPVPLATASKLWALLGRLLKAVAEDGSVTDLPSLNKHLFQVMNWLQWQVIRGGWGWLYFCRQWVWPFLLELLILKKATMKTRCCVQKSLPSVCTRSFSFQNSPLPLASLRQQ